MGERKDERAGDAKEKRSAAAPPPAGADGRMAQPAGDLDLAVEVIEKNERLKEGFVGQER